MTAPADTSPDFSNDETVAPLVSLDTGASSVQVAVRVRPMLPQEAGNTQCTDVLASSSSSSVLDVIRLGGEAGPKFTFDQVFPLTTSQHDVYRHRVSPLVASCLEGYNATILAYGQTGSGKTHTIMGPSGSITTAVQDERQAGVIPRAIRSIFEQLEGWGSSDKESADDLDDDVSDRKNRRQSEEEKSSSSSSTYEYDVRVQFLEVYGQEIRDLLTTQQTGKKLSIRDVGMAEPEVVGASEVKVESAEEALLCLTRGMYRRVTGATAMNETSSRSHAIFSLIVEQSAVMDQIGGTPSKARSEDGGDDPMQRHVQAKRSKFNFVDLAGSERQKRTQASGQRLKEGININQGLLVLGNVISALGDPKKQGKTFVPYRDSNLTRLLKGSLGGNHKTLMIACVSPASNNMEETLNCLRYANRAKNIQNHAVVNVDATSRLVSELRSKLQLLASDLLKARDGNFVSLSIPLEVIESLAKGGDGESLSSNAQFSSTPLQMRTNTPYAKENAMPTPLNIQAELELQQLKAENEVYRLKVESLMDGRSDPTEALQHAFMARAAEYEREIATLRYQGGSPMTPSRYSGVHQPDFEKAAFDGEEISGVPNLAPRTPSRRSSPRAESPELSRLRAQMFGSMAKSNNLDAEVEAEEKAVVALTTKYLGRIGEEDDDGHPVSETEEPEDTTVEDFTIRLEAEVVELSHSINAKEELIQKLQVSQKKYEAMREFYQEKLREMEILLAEKEQETEKLSEELSKLDKDHSGTHELADRLKKKQQQVAELKRKQAELTRLTTVASKNESQIAKLTNEVTDMKHKKVELQKQMTAERKSHAIEVQKLKKESMQQQRELNKVKQLKDKKTMEAERAQHMAKTRLEQVYQLKNKYKESEKRLRILTVKRGVMSRAGLDPVMVGRRQSKNAQYKKSQPASDEQSEESINLDGLRDFFDQKVADVGRREALAEKLAQEWEEHLDLSSQREELLQDASEDVRESIESLDSRIKYKEERIRQLASRLGKPKRDSAKNSADEEAFLFTNDFKKHVGNASPMLSTKLAAKVLFGMIVRERRRIAALARTASALDEKVQEAEAGVAAKDAAFRAYVDEQRLEAAELAQSQQQHILSLMDMVREDPDDGTTAADLSSPVRSAKARHADKANSKLLLLANERIAALERQLSEMQLGRETIQQHRERESEARALFDEKTSECEGLEEELNDLRTAMRRIREELAIQDDFSVADEASEEGHQYSKNIMDIIINSLHPKSHSGDISSKRRRRSNVPKGTITSKGTIRRQTEFVHTSDSDEVPDWADDIMKDLEIIAKGEMPTSLMESPDVIHAEACLDNQNVFDRLNNPESFTGVQKQKKKSQRGTKKPRTGPEPATDGQRQRKMISKQVANSLDKLVVPGIPSASDSIRRASRDYEKDDAKSRSVFDRLLSPSNLTGTQRQRYQEKKGKRGSDKTPDEHGRVSDESTRSLASSDHADPQEAEDVLNDILDDSEGSDSKLNAHAIGGKSQATRNREEYKGLDVFERLNKTTTQAYAVKQHVNIAEKLLDDLLEESERESERQIERNAERFDDSKAEFHTNRVDAYTQQNVFERLQKTTTMAYAVKQNNLAEKQTDYQQEQHENSATSLGGISPDSKAKVLAFSIASGSSSKDPGEILDDLLDESTSNGEDVGVLDTSTPRTPIRSRLRPRP